MKKFAVCLLLGLTLISCIFDIDNNEDFSFIINVKDLDGNPVEGLKVSLLNKINCPFWEEFQWTSRAQTTIRLTISYACSTELFIEDIERNQVRTLVNEEVVPGYHSINWDGTDDNGNHLHSGVYFSNVILTKNDTVSFQAERTMYMLSLDPNHKNGTTDSEGKFNCLSKKPFINLAEVDSLQIVDEDGVIYGMETFSDTTAICLRDSENDEIRQFIFAKVKDKKNVFNITWDPENLGRITAENSENSVTPVNTISRDVGGILIPILEEISNYPNPFN